MPRHQRNPAAAGPPVAEGQVWSIPLARLGHCAIVVARAPAERTDPDFVFVYLRPLLFESEPSPRDIPPLGKWGTMWVGRVLATPFRKGRWSFRGDLPGFTRHAWPVPPCRSSAVDECEPREKWGKRPWGEMWSVETTADDPSMTLIDNVPAGRDEALRFPHVDTICGASHLEQGLSRYFKRHRLGYSDMDFMAQPITPSDPAHWFRHAAAARAAWSGTPAEQRSRGGPGGWWPAGRRTDRSLRPGLWLGLPLTGGGFGCAMLIDKPPKHFRVFADSIVMGMRRRWDRWPTIEECRALKPDDGTLVEQTSMLCVRDGRWRVLGEHPGFDPGEWVWPRPWWQGKDEVGTSFVRIKVSEGESKRVWIDPDVLAMDPDAGNWCAGSSSYSYVEQQIAMIMNGTSLWLDGSKWGGKPRIPTPERLAAWRAINREIDRALRQDIDVRIT